VQAWGPPHEGQPREARAGRPPVNTGRSTMYGRVTRRYSCMRPPLEIFAQNAARGQTLGTTNARAVTRKRDIVAYAMLAPLGDVRPGERRGAAAAFLTIFGILAGHTLLETARDARLRARLPPSELPR